MYKQFCTKDWKYGISFEWFPKSAKKNISKVYHTGIRCWKDSLGCNFYSLVLYRFRIIIWKQDEKIGCYHE